MKKSVTIIFLLLIASFVWSQKIGTKITTPFSTARTISILSDNRIFVGTESDGLYYSPDNGVTWVSLSFPYKQTGMVYKTNSGDLYVDASYNGLYRSKNETGNWELVGFQDVEIDRMFEHANGNLLFHISAYNNAVYSSVYTFYLSKDNGSTWKSLPSQNSFSKSLGLGIAIHPNKTIYIGTYQGLYKSTDGESWSYCEPGTVYATAIRSNGLIYFTTSNEIRTTMDNGTTLGIVPITQTPFVTTKIFKDQQENLFAETSDYTSSYLYKNTNGTTTWNLLGELSGVNTHAYVKQIQMNSFGDIFYVDNGSVFKINQTVTDVAKDSYSQPTEFHLFQNYPNPFNPVTNITYALTHTEVVHLSVYDLLGNEVVVLVNEIKQPGTYVVRFDGSNLSSGVYFYSLQMNNYTKTKKFLLIK
ncbi:MAG: T9SS type A sorting domain-containing protein [Candidatus Paceibacterota bacterium]